MDSGELTLRTCAWWCESQGSHGSDGIPRDWCWTSRSDKKRGKTAEAKMSSGTTLILCKNSPEISEPWTMNMQIRFQKFSLKKINRYYTNCFPGGCFQHLVKWTASCNHNQIQNTVGRTWKNPWQLIPVLPTLGMLEQQSYQVFEASQQYVVSSGQALPTSKSHQ